MFWMEQVYFKRMTNAMQNYGPPPKPMLSGLGSHGCYDFHMSGELIPWMDDFFAAPKKPGIG